MEIKSINILKFETGKILMYPLRMIKDHGSYAIPPYVVKKDITYEELATEVIAILELSEIGLAPSRGHENL